MFNSAYYFKKKLVSIHLFIWYFSTVTWIKRKEMSSWENSVLDLPEFLSLLTCWLVVLMSNKFLWLSIMIYPQTEKITFTGNCPKKIFFSNTELRKEYWNIFSKSMMKNRIQLLKSVLISFSCSHSDQKILICVIYLEIVNICIRIWLTFFFNFQNRPWWSLWP